MKGNALVSRELEKLLNALTRLQLVEWRTDVRGNPTGIEL